MSKKPRKKKSRGPRKAQRGRPPTRASLGQMPGAAAPSAATPGHRSVGPLASVIIPVLDQLEYTKLCIESLFEHTPFDRFELIVIDNGSGTDTAEYLKSVSEGGAVPQAGDTTPVRDDPNVAGGGGAVARESSEATGGETPARESSETAEGELSTDQADAARPQPPVKVVRFKENQGIAPAWNAGIRAARGRYLVFADNDVLFSAGWLDELLAGFAGDDVWATVPNITEMFVPHDFGRRAPDMLAQPLMADEEILSGSFFVLPAKTIMRLGTFDERFGIGPYADLDYQFRLMTAGKKVLRVHNVCIHHFEGRTVTQIPGFFDELEEQNRRHFEQKWNPSVPLPPMKEDFEFEIWMRKVKMVPPPDTDEIRRRTHYETVTQSGGPVRSEGGHPARIIACINIFNDLKVLPDCLASLEGVDEIVVVDGAYAAIEHDAPYSTDGTLEYLKDLAAGDPRIRLIECTRAWEDEPAKRSAYFIGADGDWYLQIDADERLEAVETNRLLRPPIGGAASTTPGDRPRETAGRPAGIDVRPDPAAQLREHLSSCLLDIHSLPRYDFETKTSRYFPRVFRHRDNIHYEAAHWNVVTENRTVAADWSAFLPVAGVRLIHLRHERPAQRLDVQNEYYKQMLANEAAAFERRAEEIKKTLSGDAQRDAEKLELMWTYVSAAAYQREYNETQ